MSEDVLQKPTNIHSSVKVDQNEQLGIEIEAKQEEPNDLDLLYEQEQIQEQDPDSVSFSESDLGIDDDDDDFEMNEPLVPKNDDREYTLCPECHKPYADIKRHMQWAHPSDELPLECGICEQKFSAKTALHKHLQNDHQLSCNTCDICNKPNSTR